MTNEVSETVILQRIRNRLIEYFELVGDPKREQKTDPNEHIVMWEDWVSDPWKAAYRAPVFTRAEQELMVRVDGLWRALVDETPTTLASFQDLYSASNWASFVAATQEALDVFMRRGKLPEDVLAT